jgi:adenosylmethionine-8-amino-7-oxononanoate aminotransferase
VKRHRIDYEALDKEHLWHPFTQMRDWMDSPQLVIERGQGVYLFDTKGNRYLDGVSSLWANIHGHRHPALVRAIRQQLTKLDHSTFLGLTNVPAVALAKKLVAVAPRNLTRVFYSDNGSTAVEVALKMSFQFWRQRGKVFARKQKFIAFSNAYHGDTLGSVSLGGVELFHRIFKPLLFKSYKVFYPDCYRCPFGKQPTSCDIYCLKEFEATLKKHHHEVCAVVVEPSIQGAAGMLTTPRGFLKRIETLCREHNVHLILDEVATAFGRTGTMFACEHEQVAPDFLALAKGLSGGTLPLAATLTTRDVFEAFLGEHTDFKSFFHGHTYTGNPLACAAAAANLDLFKSEKTLQQLKPKIAYLKGRLADFWQLQHVGDIRQAGFMVGIELVKDRDSKTPYPAKDRIGHAVVLEARRRGVILRPLGNVIVLMPPLSISRAQLQILLDVTYGSIATATTESEQAPTSRRSSTVYNGRTTASLRKKRKNSRSNIREGGHGS